MPETSTRPCFGCRSGAAGQKIVARFFTALLLRLSLRRGRTENYCPKLQRGTTSVHGFVAAADRALPGFSPRPCFRLSLRRGRTETRCPKLQRGLPSVHGFDAADARALSVFSPRLAFGCRFGAGGLKSIARNFNAALLRCMDLTRQTPGHCPVLHRALLSVVSHARPD